MGRRRKVDVAKILELRSKGWSIKDIAEKLGVSRQTVYIWLRKAVLKRLSKPSARAVIMIETKDLTPTQAAQLVIVLDELMRKVETTRCDVWWFPVQSKEVSR